MKYRIKTINDPKMIAYLMQIIATETTEYFNDETRLSALNILERIRANVCERLPCLHKEVTECVDDAGFVVSFECDDCGKIFQ